MRLLFLITDLELGGTPIVVRELATRLRDPNTHIEVACLKPAGMVADQLRERGITVTSFEARRVSDFRHTVRALADLVRERQIDTVFSFLIHANFIASRVAKVMPGVRFLQSIQTAQSRPRWHWWLQRRIHHRAARLIVPSESVALRAIERSNVPRAKLVVIPNAVDADAFPKLDMPASPLTDASRVRVGFVGRLDPVKRVQDLIRALTMLPAGFHLDIFGEGAERPALMSLVKQLRLEDRVQFHGRVVEPLAAYRAVDLLVLPSDAEGFGLVLIEAMAAGVPVVATDVDGIRDVVDNHRTGLLVPARDPASLKAAIERVAFDTSLRSQLIQNARVDVEQRFTWSPVLQQYRSVLQIG
jgi:glycosyltransferase involved in cell wall biosynthesis